MSTKKSTPPAAAKKVPAAVKPLAPKATKAPARQSAAPVAATPLKIKPAPKPAPSTAVQPVLKPARKSPALQPTPASPSKARPKAREQALAAPAAKPARRRPAPGAQGIGPAVAAAPDIVAYQIYFGADQRPQLDPAFIPLDNSGRQNPLLEFGVFERLAADEGVRLAPLWGALSWRFTQKTGLSGAAYLAAVRKNPGFDLYYCNPSPENEGLYANGWQQGVTTHPAFRELCEAVFTAAGLDAQLLDAITPSQSFSSCNYFIGGPRFWNTYLPFVRGVVDRARRKLPAATLAVLDSKQGDPRGLHAGASYWPFIIERLLPVFLRGPGEGLKTFKVALPAPEARLNAHIKRLREMKDVAHRTQSQWMYSCWLHYRNLFLLQAAGREWSKRYLPLITPNSVQFL
jgi:hypothetical protein